MNKAWLGLAGLAYLAVKPNPEDESKKENPKNLEPLFEDDEIDPKEKRELRKLWREWNGLVNMSAFEIKQFMNSSQGLDAGLSRKEAKKKGIRSGRDSARALIRMIPKGRTFKSAMRNWSETDWQWASHQVAFIKRMSKLPGPLFKQKGEMSRKMKSLLIWGHDPRR